MSTATAAAPAAQHIQAKMVGPFINSVRAVFTTMVKAAPVTVEKPHIKAIGEPAHDVSAIIGFSGEVVGSVVVSFQMSAAVALVSSFAGMPIEPGTPDFADAAGEIANMIAGHAKKDLGVVASITVPSVIIGPGHTVARLSDVPCVVIPCTTSVGNFTVEISVKRVSP